VIEYGLPCRQHRLFLRLCAGLFSITKARLIIGEQGDRLFKQ
jgi:hypothetical protein